MRSRAMVASVSDPGSEMCVDVVELDTGRQHQDLGVVQELADLLRGAVPSLVLGGHPGLGGLLDQLLADGMDPGVELAHGARSLGAGPGLLAQLGPEVLEALHGRPAYGVAAATSARARAVSTAAAVAS